MRSSADKTKAVCNAIGWFCQQTGHVTWLGDTCIQVIIFVCAWSLMYVQIMLVISSGFVIGWPVGPTDWLTEWLTGCWLLCGTSAQYDFSCRKVELSNIDLTSYHDDTSIRSSNADLLHSSPSDADSLWLHRQLEDPFHDNRLVRLSIPTVYYSIVIAYSFSIWFFYILSFYL